MLTYFIKYKNIISFLGIKCSQNVDLFSFWPFSILFSVQNLINDVIKRTHTMDLIEKSFTFGPK